METRVWRAGNRGNLESFLAGEILGQEEATRAFARAVLRGEAGTIERGRPRSFLLLLGETGVGKTETVLATARHLYSDVDTVVRLDMAEYAERGPGLARLVGTGLSDTGLLGAELARARVGARGRPGGIFLLLDEIEKAHPDITRLFLGMEAARLTTANGARLDLEDVHVVCTSNLGSEAARDLAGQAPYAYVRTVVEEDARAFFGSAVFARFGEVIVYRGLSLEVQRKICEQKVLRKLAFLSGSLGASVVAGPEVVEFLLRRGYHRDLGARRMRHVIDRELGDAVVAYCLREAVRDAHHLRFQVGDGGLFLSPVDQ